MRGRVVTETGQGCPAVLVSDGVTVTTTATDGSYSLVPAGPFVSITRPAGMTADPWFVPANADDVTFTLRRRADPFPYRFVHVSDLHVSAGPAAGEIYPQPVELGDQAALSEFLVRLPDRAGDVQSVIATGDLTDMGIDEEFTALSKAVADSPLPVHLLPGNHDHIAGRLSRIVSRTNYQINTGDPGGYERNLGPRWYSFDLPGLHVVALDWHTHELGLDDTVQDAWIRADLESVPAGTPWILLSHDQPWHSILDGLPSQPVATFSGHRHTSRVVQVGGTLHVNTPTPLFAGLDYSPPSYRIVTWDGHRISLDTRAVAPTGLERSTFDLAPAALTAPADHATLTRTKHLRWRHQLPGAGHRSPVRLAGDTVIAGVKLENRAAGAVDALSLADGSLRWRAVMRSSVKGTPATYRDTVIAVEVSGDVVCLALASGTEIWRVPSPDPLRLFAWSDPVLAGDTLIVGDLSDLRGLGAATGELRWRRRDLAPYQTIAAQSAPVVVPQASSLDDAARHQGLVVFAGAWPNLPVALDVTTGVTRWPADRAPRGLDIGADAPIGTPLLDPESGDLFMPAPGRVLRIDATTGSPVWSTPTALPFTPATPLSSPWGVAVADAGAGLSMLDRTDGSTIWQTPVARAGDLAMTSYTRTPHALFASPTLLGDLIVAPGLDGVLHIVDARTGEPREPVDLGVPVAAPIIEADDLLLAVGVDGSVLAIERRDIEQSAVR